MLQLPTTLINAHRGRKWLTCKLAFINSKPDSSATIMGKMNGNETSTPFSVPTQRALWAGINVDTWMGICRSLPNAEETNKNNTELYICTLQYIGTDTLYYCYYALSVGSRWLPSILLMEGAISRSCMTVSVVPWKRRRVASYLNEIHTPFPTATMWETSAFLLGCTEKVD